MSVLTVVLRFSQPSSFIGGFVDALLIVASSSAAVLTGELAQPAFYLYLSTFTNCKTVSKKWTYFALNLKDKGNICVELKGIAWIASLGRISVPTLLLPGHFGLSLSGGGLNTAADEIMTHLFDLQWLHPHFNPQTMDPAAVDTFPPLTCYVGLISVISDLECVSL